MTADLTPAQGATTEHGHHVPHPVNNADKIRWWPAQREQRERELRWTCSCRSVVYVLVAGGGGAWIRRFHSSETTETVRMHPDAAVALWAKILAGEAV
ncbi:hypothetical protein ABGB17_20305 [Sphaerisporangium sp. B11E5]|uniref:hypothetical protein n=1 Tax=Sphaerisporangium sp. B11E5 TaxID=3153563 RepID=UPI00325F1262